MITRARDDDDDDDDDLPQVLSEAPSNQHTERHAILVAKQDRTSLQHDLGPQLRVMSKIDDLSLRSLAGELPQHSGAKIGI